MMLFLLFTAGLLSFLQGIYCAQWASSSPQDGIVMYACADGSVTLPWKYILSSGDILRDTEWLYNGNSQEMIAIFSHGNFLPTPSFANRVQAVDNAGITVTHLTVADSGNYSVEVNLDGDSGTHTVLCRSINVQISNQLMTQDGYLHVAQRSEPVLDTSTDQWAIQLQCGVFTFRGDPPYQVQWITPSGDVVNSSDFIHNHFNLLLTNPLQGGNYTCRIPPQHAADACLHGNDTSNSLATVYVDRVDARLLLLEKEKDRSDARLHLLEEENRQVKTQLTQWSTRVVKLEDRASQQIGFHARASYDIAPSANTPLVVNNVHYNHGNAYDRTTGYFTVPYPGVYFFTTTTTAYAHGTSAYFYLYVDNTLMNTAYTHTGDYNGLSTINGVAHLTTSQKVSVRGDGNKYWGHVTSFSGFLISPDP